MVRIVNNTINSSRKESGSGKAQSDFTAEIEVFEKADEVADLALRYRDELLSFQPNPFASWDWYLAWLECFPDAFDQIQFILVRSGEKSGQNSGLTLFPLIRKGNQLDFAGSDLGDFQDVLTNNPERVPEAISCLRAWSDSEGLELHFAKLSDRSFVKSELMRVAEESQELSFRKHLGPCPFFALDSEGLDGVLSRLGKSTRKGIRRRMRKYAATHGDHFSVCRGVDREFLEKAIDGLLHVSDMSWTRKISHPNEMLEKGQEIECRVLSVDQDRRRIALGLKQLDEDPWATDIPGKYQAGELVKGNVTKITNFGVFVGLEDGLEGLLHISELADHKVENPEEIVKVGDEIEVKILRVDTDDRKIGLSRKRVEWAEEDEAAAAEAEAGGPGRVAPADLKGGLGEGGPLIKMGGADEAEEPAPSEEAAPAEASASEEAVADEAAEEPEQPTE